MQATLRPVACSSPQPANEPNGSTITSSKQRVKDPQLRSVTAAGITGLHAEPSTASTAGYAHRAGLDQQPSSASLCSAAGYSSRAAAAYGALRGEASSCLSAEASRLSAVGAAVLLGQPADAPKRSAALPAARRMVLERQVGLPGLDKRMQCCVVAVCVYVPCHWAKLCGRLAGPMCCLKCCMCIDQTPGSSRQPQPLFSNVVQLKPLLALLHVSSQ
jgi:hypothetical protein